jgi:hypothetical protein
MLQTIKPAQRKFREEERFLDPTIIKERFYGLILSGDCLHPVFKDGEKVAFDRAAPLEVGCYACLYYRPELVKPGRLGLALKRLVTAVPYHVTFPYHVHPESEVANIIIVEQHNPPHRWVVECKWLLAVHRCIGSVTDPKVRAQLEAEGYRL